MQVITSNELLYYLVSFWGELENQAVKKPEYSGY